MASAIKWWCWQDITPTGKTVTSTHTIHIKMCHRLCCLGEVPDASQNGRVGSGLWKMLRTFLGREVMKGDKDQAVEEFPLWCCRLRIRDYCSTGVGWSCSSNSISALKLPYATGAAKKKKKKNQSNWASTKIDSDHSVVPVERPLSFHCQDCCKFYKGRPDYMFILVFPHFSILNITYWKRCRWSFCPRQNVYVSCIFSS